MPRDLNGQLAQTEMQNTPMCFALLASVPLSAVIGHSVVPDNFVVHRVEELFAFADQMLAPSMGLGLRPSVQLSKIDPVNFVEQQVKNAQGRVNNLTQSILAKAFRGELTAQWRAENLDLISGDNSAEALLAKIQAEREKLRPKKAAKKKSTAKKSARKKKDA